MSLLQDGQGKTIAVAATFKRGRILAIGDSDIFARPQITYGDNARFLVNSIGWLAAGVAGDDPEIRKASAQVQITAEAEVARLSAGPVVELDKEERESLEQLVDLVEQDPYEATEEFLHEAALVFHQFPRRVRDTILRFRDSGSDDGVLMLRGFPADRDIPPTPTVSGTTVRRQTCLAELWMSCVGRALGDPVAYIQEKEGRLFQDVFPTKTHEADLSSESSSILLDFHTEIAFHPHMPDYILLYGLRQDPQREARTIYASVRHMFSILTPAQQDILFSESFHTGVDLSFGNRDQQAGKGPLVSVLYGHRADPFLRYDLDLMTGESDAEAAALEAVKRAVNVVKRDVTIEPGDLLILDNRRCVHARSKFTAFYDGRDRWLKRIAVVRDLNRSVRDRTFGGRIIETDFSKYFE